MIKEEAVVVRVGKACASRISSARTARNVRKLQANADAGTTSVLETMELVVKVVGKICEV